MSHTLSLNNYPVFENNQVLTSTQLNELATYLDQQTRLTRLRCIGIGIPCGLIPGYDIVTNTLTITEGTGITSEGFLLETGACEFTQYRDYSLPLSVEYEPFINPNTATQYPLWELLPASYTPVGPEVVAPLDFTFVNGITPGQKKVVLLFAEWVNVLNDSCLGSSCQAFGGEFTMTLRKLLITVDHLKLLLAENGSTDLTYTAKFDLPDILSTLPLFDPSLAHSRDYFQFSQNFKNAAASVYKRVPTDPKDLLNVLRQTYTIFEPILKDTYNNINPFLDAQIPNLNVWNEIMDGVNSPTNGPSYFGIQYFYDFLRDLLLAYNEFRDAAFDFMSDCCFDTHLFPKHLLLGEAVVVDPDKPSQYRNHFVGVPLTPQQRTAESLLIALHVRITLMVRMFDVTFVHNPNPVNPPVTRITPSFEKWGKLSDRSIPAYFKIDTIDPLLGTLERVWNFKNVLRNKDVSGQYPVVAYGNQSSNQGAPIDPIQTPLFYDQDQFTFLRVEGQNRKKYDDVLKEIDALVRKFDLPIRAVAVRLQGTATAEDILKRCDFSDLRSQYTGVRNEMMCKMRRFFDHFFTSSSSPKAKYGIRKAPPAISSMYTAAAGLNNTGNSSAAFLPAYFALPGQSVAHLAPPFQYAPVSTLSVSEDILDYMNQLMNRMVLLCQTDALLPPELDKFDYGADTNDIDVSFIGSYVEAVTLANVLRALFMQLNDQVTRSTRTKFPTELYFQFGMWMQEELYFLNEFITDCRFRTLEAIYYTLQYRIGYLQAKDPTLFSNFIERNPGITHKAGVPYGGTIVLVYPGTPLNFAIKTRDQLAFQLQEIKVLEVQKQRLRATRGRSAAETAELAVVESKLCGLYEQQATVQVRPGILGGAVSAIPIRRINIEQDMVIGDFCLPYLTNCNCECDDIPAPLQSELGLPKIGIPAFFNYNPGDYAFTKDIQTHTTGCTTPAQVTIDVRPFINFDSKDAVLVLKFVVNGATPVTSFDSRAVAGALTTTTTSKGGSVLIRSAGSNYQVFTYTPPKNFLGVDSFEYVFELYSIKSDILQRSTKSTVWINVHPRCTVPGVQNFAVEQQGPISTL